MNKGVLAVVSGFSGSGKGTLMKALTSQYDNYALSVSATTRKPRPNEKEGREYFFKTREEFEKMISRDELIEYAQYVQNYYGTPKAYVQEQMEKGKDVILEIEIQGALEVKEKYPEAVLIFVTPPSAEELKRRLTERGTESEEVIESRLNRAYEEASYMKQYDYLLINDDLQECVENMHQMIAKEHCKIQQNQVFIENMKKELKVFKKGDSI
ncbi:MAG TPA: guanylate kinase [Candidatus Blautia avistercoris]|uniref:guanylate kinase n=1 Tax=Blautia sp. An249 TaxID=1965603 RepID=UPI000B396750|nr:guanylate kinase [Blautia sp. An249]OUO80324.1 guanylate kinase [Blautia sp. An249]HIY19816.1 guanylate kinase [Candidatus Blautia avistercoris]